MLDVQLYEQIIYNVFANALKFNKVRGTIRISLQVAQAQKIGL